MRRFLLTSGMLAMTIGAIALPAYLKTFSDNYKIVKDSNIGKARCVVCHVSATNHKLNAYGTQVNTAMETAKAEKLTVDILKTVEKLKIDKDGLTNGENIKKDILPASVVKK